MVKTVYIDVLFFVNLVINHLILSCTAFLSGTRRQRLRIIIAAALGAAYGVCVFFKELSFLNSLAFKCGIALLMVGCSFGFRDLKRLLRLFLVFFGISFAFGGIVFALYLLGIRGVYEIRNNTYYINLPPAVLFSSAALAYILLLFAFRHSNGGEKKRQFCRIQVQNSNRTTEFTALCDTGNSLCDPLTNAPVIICDYTAAREILPESAQRVLDKKSPASFPLAASELPPELKFRLIPYKTLSSSFAMLLAFRPEKILVDGKNSNGTVLALSPGRISDCGAYAAII